MSNPRRIGRGKQLLLDAGLRDSHEGISFRMARPYRSDCPLIELDEPYETAVPGSSIGSYSTVMRVDGTVRAWWYYHSGNPEDMNKRRVCYAESEDGVHFEKPTLGFFDMGGTTATNAVMGDPIQGATVWVDPKAPPESRFRSQAKWGPFPGTDTKLCFYASPDGIRWRRTHDVQIGACDTQNIVFWDDAYGRYVMYTREWVRFDDASRSFRQVRRMESDDLIAWGDESIVYEADAADLATHETSTGQPPMDYYGACVFKYPEADSLYIMFAQAFWHWMDRPAEERWGYSPDPKSMSKKIVRLAPSTMDVRIGYSRDGQAFERSEDRGAFLSNGPLGRYDSKMVWALPEPIVTDDEIWIYYVGGNRDHDGFIDSAAGVRQSGIGRAVIRLDGFVGAVAGYDPGTLVTAPLIFEGNSLELNCDASGGGAIRVEILDEEGKPMEGFTKNDTRVVTGNSVRMPVTWAGGGTPGKHEGRPVRLRFTMQDSALYAFHFR